MEGVLITVLGGLGCIAMMGVGMWVVARLMTPRSRWGAIVSDRVARLFGRHRWARRLGGTIESLARKVQIERPDLRKAAAPDGTVTILFSDVVDSTKAAERLGDRGWLELMREHNSIIRGQIHSFDGYEVKSQGDGFMVAFSSARAALRCATAIQQAFAEHGRERPRDAIQVRVGLHTGEVIHEDGDFFGRNVILAARIADQARGGEILASEVVKALAESSREIDFGGRRELELKGLKGSHPVYEVDWREERAEEKAARVTPFPTTMARRTAS